MGAPQRGSAFLEQFKEFTGFLQSLWGILAGISIFFPLSNQLLAVIPVTSNGATYDVFSTQLVTSIATLITLFVILSTFGERNKIKKAKNRDQVKHNAWLGFIIGVVAMVLYLITYYGIYDWIYGPLEIWGGDPLRIFGDVLLTLLYSTFFALITRAFMLLGLIEFLEIE